MEWQLKGPWRSAYDAYRREITFRETDRVRQRWEGHNHDLCLALLKLQFRNKTPPQGEKLRDMAAAIYVANENKTLAVDKQRVSIDWISFAITNSEVSTTLKDCPSGRGGLRIYVEALISTLNLSKAEIQLIKDTVGGEHTEQMRTIKKATMSLPLAHASEVRDVTHYRRLSRMVLTQAFFDNCAEDFKPYRPKWSLLDKAWFKLNS